MKLNIVVFLTIFISYVKASELFSKKGRDFIFDSRKFSKQGLKDTYDSTNDESRFKHSDKKSLQDEISEFSNGVNPNEISNYIESSPKYDYNGEYNIASNANGSILLAGSYSWKLLVSYDFGVTWNTLRKHPAGSFLDVALSSSGQKIVVASQVHPNITFYTSFDYGCSWKKAESHEYFMNSNFFHLASNFDGNVVFAAGKSANGNVLTKSTNSGVTYSTILTKSSELKCFAISEDGIKIIVGVDNQLLLSTDGGNSFNQSNNHPSLLNKAWTSCTISGDGEVMYAAAQSDFIYVSKDMGANWDCITCNLEPQPPSQNSNRNWGPISTSRNGSTIAAVNENSNEKFIYTSHDYGIVWEKYENNLQSNSRVSVAMTSNGEGIAFSIRPKVYTSRFTPSITAVIPSCVNPNDDDFSDFNDDYYADDGDYDDTIWLPKSPPSQLVNIHDQGWVITEGLGSQSYCDRYSENFYANDTIVQATGSSLILKDGFLVSVGTYFTDINCSPQSGHKVWCNNNQGWYPEESPSWYPEWAIWNCSDDVKSHNNPSGSIISNSFGQIIDPNDPTSFVHAIFPTNDCKGPPICTGYDSMILRPSSAPDISSDESSFTLTDKQPEIKQKSLVYRQYGNDCTDSNVIVTASLPVSKCFTELYWFEDHGPADVILHDDCTGYTKFESSNGTCTGRAKVRNDQSDIFGYELQTCSASNKASVQCLDPSGPIAPPPPSSSSWEKCNADHNPLTFQSMDFKMDIANVNKTRGLLTVTGLPPSASSLTFKINVRLKHGDSKKRIAKVRTSGSPLSFPMPFEFSEPVDFDYDNIRVKFIAKDKSIASGKQKSTILCIQSSQ